MNLFIDLVHLKDVSKIKTILNALKLTINKLKRLINYENNAKIIQFDWK